MLLNLGCGHQPIVGYTNVDAYADEADIKGDIRELTFTDVGEVQLKHVLEHFPWRDTLPVLERIHSWMRPGAMIVVEVPDMAPITAEAMRNPDWIRYLYGSQEHEGEYHRSGFTVESLTSDLIEAGFTVGKTVRFRSQNQHRLGMPCICVWAFA